MKYLYDTVPTRADHVPYRRPVFQGVADIFAKRTSGRPTNGHFASAMVVGVITRSTRRPVNVARLPYARVWREAFSHVFKPNSAVLYFQFVTILQRGEKRGRLRDHLGEIPGQATLVGVLFRARSVAIEPQNGDARTWTSAGLPAYSISFTSDHLATLQR